MSDYKPPLSVRLAHSIPRVQASTDGSVGEGDAEFSISIEYITSLIAFPVALLVVGLLSVIIFQIVLICRCICKKWKCCHVSYEPISLTRNMIFFIIFIIVALVADNLQYFGNNYLTIGMRDARRGIGDIYDIFINLITVSTGIGKSGENIKYTAGLNRCPSDLSGVGSAAGLLVTASSELKSIVSKVPDNLEIAMNGIKTGINNKDLVMYIFYGFIELNLILLVLAGCLKSKCFTQLMIALAEIIVFLLTIICVVEMIIVMLFGDFCMNPADNIINLLPDGSYIGNITAYYTKCVGENPINDTLADVLKKFTDVNETFNNITSQSSTFNQSYPDCLPDLNDITSNIKIIIENLDLLGEQIECGPLYSAWNNIVNIGLCSNGFSGLFILWICQFVTSGMLFIVMCIASVMFLQYHPPIAAMEGEAVAYKEAEYLDDAPGAIEEGNKDFYEEPAGEQYHHDHDVEMVTKQN